MSHPQPGHTYDEGIEHILEAFPDKVADALIEWRQSSLMREKEEALLYLNFKGQDTERSATEIKAMVNSSEGRYQAVLRELRAEGEYNRLYEKLLGAKKIASLRTAF